MTKYGPFISWRTKFASLTCSQLAQNWSSFRQLDRDIRLVNDDYDYGHGIGNGDDHGDDGGATSSTSSSSNGDGLNVAKVSLFLTLS